MTAAAASAWHTPRRGPRTLVLELFDPANLGGSSHVSAAIDYVRRWLPGLLPEPFAEATCLYTSTPSTDFIIDRVGDVVVASACSGHGAKLAPPAVGRIVTDLVTGSAQTIPRFTLEAHLRD